MKNLNFRINSWITGNNFPLKYNEIQYSTSYLYLKDYIFHNNYHYNLILKNFEESRSDYYKSDYINFEESLYNSSNNKNIYFRSEKNEDDFFHIFKDMILDKSFSPVAVKVYDINTKRHNIIFNCDFFGVPKNNISKLINTIGKSYFVMDNSITIRNLMTYNSFEYSQSSEDFSSFLKRNIKNILYKEDDSE